ncbi:ABC transporter substrate-binding protein [Niveispirillum lacus]|uniref:ABC transporter substrate-binding protein n=1 Tax=Niveispirillum lacus TaxID=1981099 RepID=UPI0013FDEDF3|nr:ABC transporter substrate-binding protein [Niveispirillum lacus]
MPRSPDPHYGLNWGDRLYYNQVYEGLAETDGHTKVLPALAESWERTDDGWLFRLRRDVRFQNGRPLTTRDVIFSLCRARNLPDAPRTFAKALGNVGALTPLDSHHLLVRLLDGDQRFPLGVATIPVVSAPVGAQWRFASPDCEGTGHIDSAAFADPSLRAGTGPYQMTEFTTDRVVLSRNPNHRDNRQPWAQVELLRLTESGLIRGILDRSVDIVYAPPLAAMEFVDAKGGVNFHLMSSTSITFLQFNWRTPAPSPLQDVRVREAIRRAIPRDVLSRRFMPGLVTPAGQVALPGAPDRSPSIPDDEYDPTAARRLLAEAGYPEGISIRMLASPSQYKVAKILALFLTKAGITTDVREDTADQVVARRRAGDYDLYCLGRIYNAADMPETLHTLLGGPGAGLLAGDRNYGGYADLAFDRLVADARAARTERARDMLVRKAAERAYANVAWIPVFHTKSAWITQSRVRMQPRLDRSLRLNEISLVETAGSL